MPNDTLKPIEKDNDKMLTEKMNLRLHQSYNIEVHAPKASKNNDVLDK